MTEATAGRIRKRFARTRENTTLSPLAILGAQTGTPWREQALARTAELMSLLVWFRQLPPPPGPKRYLEDEARDQLCQETAKQLEAVTETTHRRLVGLAAISGAAVERAFGLLNAAEANILRLAPAGYVLSVLPNLHARARLSLVPDDERLKVLAGTGGVAGIGRPVADTGVTLPDAERGAIVAAFEGANAAARIEQLRVRSFRNVILSTAFAAAALTVLISVFGFINPTWAPLCFEPTGEIVCATSSAALPGPPAPTVGTVADRWDTAVVAFMGMLGAAISAVAALRGMRSSADPYSLPVALAVLKVPVGALTAVLGILLISAGFVPGLSALDSSAQIIAWAIVLGYAQQLFTRLVDSQAQTVLAQSQVKPNGNGSNGKAG